jgi:hypothetical protein
MARPVPTVGAVYDRRLKFIGFGEFICRGELSTLLAKEGRLRRTKQMQRYLNFGADGVVRSLTYLSFSITTPAAPRLKVAIRQFVRRSAPSFARRGKRLRTEEDPLKVQHFSQRS